MTVAIAEKEKTFTSLGNLKALDFDAVLTPVYDQSGHEIPGYRRVFREDRDETLSIVSDQYKLVQHKDALQPAVALLHGEGWGVKASRVERNGASAFVELERRDKTVTIVGQQVGERLMLRNSYDKSSSLSFTLGAIVLICGNGAVAPRGKVGFSGHHVGDLDGNFKNFLSTLGKIEKEFATHLLNYYEGMDKRVPEDIGREIVRRSLGERQEQHIRNLWTRGIGRSGDHTAWDLYNGVTQYLTHEFKGNWDRREKLNQTALTLISGYVNHGMLPKTEEPQ